MHHSMYFWVDRPNHHFVHLRVTRGRAAYSVIAATLQIVFALMVQVRPSVAMAVAPCRRKAPVY
jgi:hypothetical protein